MINNYKIGKVLGEGCTGEVREATSTLDKTKVALKVFTSNLDMLNNEAFQHSQLEHQYILKQVDACIDATFRNGEEEINVGYIATELLPKGELLNYLIGKGGLPLSIVKYYAKQMIEGISYMHGRGIAHRDLKLENILLDENYDIKIADFGFACPIQGESGMGFSNRFVGTMQYMAPELQAGRTYQAQVADWYSFGVMLFMMYSGSAPFVKADLDDPHFNCIARNDLDKFWRSHEQGRKEGFFTPEFKDLISSLLAYQPFQRLSCADIVFHPFFTRDGSQNGAIANRSQVAKEMSKREPK